MRSTHRRLTTILSHLYPAPLPAAACDATTHRSLRPFHTRLARSRVTALTDAQIALSRLPASLTLSAALPASTTVSTYSSVWSSIAAAASSSSSSPPKAIIPPQSSADDGKLTVVLDMDECLLHSTFDDSLPASVPPGDLKASPPPTALHAPYRHPSLGYPYNITFTIGDTLAREERVYTSFRPHLLPFLQSLNRSYEVILFTSALPVYAAPILAYLSSAVRAMDGDGSQPLFRHQLYRASTVPLASFPYVKDIRRLGRDMRRIVIVDNNPLAMLATPDNAILVPDWNGGDSEQPEVLREVLKLLERVEALRVSGSGSGGVVAEGGGEGDVRPLLRKALKFREQLEAAGVDLAANGVTLKDTKQL